VTHDGGVTFPASDDTVRAKRAHPARTIDGSIRGSIGVIFDNATS